MKDGCLITIDGNHAGTYETNCNTIQYIEDGTLRNTYSSTIYLYPQGHTQTYPRIALPSYSQPVYYSAANNYNNVTGITRTDFNIYSQLYYYDQIYSPIICSLLFFSVLINTFRRGH